VLLTYVSPKGRALIDRELYLPVSWTEDRDRCAEAGIDGVEFATKPELARRMLARLLKQSIDIGWFTADEAYGDNPALRAWLEDQQVNYVMAISCDTRLATPTGPVRVDELAAMTPKRGWQRLSAGAGSKGQRLYDWLLIDPGADSHPLLVRRSISSGELAYYIVHTTSPQPLVELVRVAGCRWGVEETFQFAKNETGLDHYQVRKYDAWYRHTVRHEAPHTQGGGRPLPLSCRSTTVQQGAA
jgi:SRSO17 transposase